MGMEPRSVEPGMSEPRPLDVLHIQLTEARDELHLARADRAHSPNADTILVAEYAELRFDRLLERLWDSMGERRRTAARRRATRTLTPV